jgi:hypothetical protein
MQTLYAQAESTGQDSAGVCIALDGDKLKPREDQRKGGNGFGVNEDGAGYTLTGVDRHGVAYGIGDGQSQAAANADEELKTLDCMHDHQAVCYENHAQDSRGQGPIDTAPTQGSSNANSADVSGNNPLVCFSKVAHPTAPNGEGERWDEREVAQTRNTFDNGEKRCQEVVVSMAQNTRDEVRIVGGDGQIAGALPAEPGMKQQKYVVSTQGLDGYNKTLTGDCAPTISGAACDLHHTHGVVSTNSNGEDVAATLTRDLAKQTGAQQQNGGGYVLVRREDSALTDSGSTETGR